MPAEPEAPVDDWLPSEEDGIDNAIVRLFVAAGIKVDTLATNKVLRSGTQAEAGAPTAFSAFAGNQQPMDGVAFLELPSGRFLYMGGAPGGRAYESVNTITVSDDRGATLMELVPNGPGSATRPLPAHTFGHGLHTDTGVLYIYWIGSDPFTPTGDVFRIPAAAYDVGGNPATPWERVSTTCPTIGLALFMYGFLGNDIFVIGGQTSIEDVGVPSRVVSRSSDHGTTWTPLADAPATVFGAQLGPLPVLDGHLWIAGSGRYSSGTTDLSNAVLKFDGTTWTTVLADGHGQFLPSRYHALVSYKNRLWRFNGSTWDGITFEADTKGWYASGDGVTWDEPIGTVPGGNTHAPSAIGTSHGLYLTEGFQSARVLVIREYVGKRIDSWEAASSVPMEFLATGNDRPIFDVTEYFGRGGVVAGGNEIMTLAVPEVAILEGCFEAWFILRTLNFDTGANQGPNQPACLLSNTGGSIWNSFGLNGADVSYKTAAPTTNTPGGAVVNRDEIHIVGFQHWSADGGSVALFVDGVQVGETVTGVGFSLDYTGYDAILGGYLGEDRAAVSLGAFCTRRAPAPWSAEIVGRLNTAWAASYRTAPVVAVPVYLLAENGTQILAENGEPLET